MWRCTVCHKVTTGVAMPYGNCFLCGGKVEEITGRSIGEPMRVRAIREAMQFELNAYHFYRLALSRSSDPASRLVLDYMSQNELDHIHELSEKYHAHLDPDALNLSPAADALLADRIFQGLDLEGGEGVRGLYLRAIEMENRTRRHYLESAERARDSFERDLYLELAAEAEEHVALLESELAQVTDG